MSDNYLWGVVSAVITTLGLLAIVKEIARNKNHKIMVDLGLRSIAYCQRVITKCQQHRGISNAVLQGNIELKRDLITTQRDLDKLIQEGITLGLDKFPQWESFIEHWSRLKIHALDRDLSSQNLLRQHNIMIDGQLSLFEDITIYNDLQWIMLNDSLHLSQVCLDTLRVVESIAQSRGIGTGICAKGYSEGIEQISLNFLKVSISSPINNMLNEFSSVDDQSLSAQLKKSSKQIKESVDKLIDVIEYQVLADDGVKIGAAEYFAVATKPIEELLSVFQYLVDSALQQPEI